MRTIWKYPLEIADRQIISVPRLYSHETGETYLWAQPIHIGEQNNVPTLWFKVDTDLPALNVEILLIGTGQEIPPDDKWGYIGTSVCNPFVWHIFARIL